MNPITSTVLLKAMDGLAMRMTAIAENVANGNTPHYRPLQVSFEAALRQAVVGGPKAINQVQPVLSHETGDANGGSSSVRLDMELASATTTRERYGALAEVLGRQLQIDDLVVSGGRS